MKNLWLKRLITLCKAYSLDFRYDMVAERYVIVGLLDSGYIAIWIEEPEESYFVVTVESDGYRDKIDVDELERGQYVWKTVRIVIEKVISF